MVSTEVVKFWFPKILQMCSEFVEGAPVVSIVGRTNVGKSSLFNKLVGRRVSIVHDSEGVTRDCVRSSYVWGGRLFNLVDSGGLEFCSDDLISSKIEEQVEISVDSSDLILFVVDSTVGLIPLDMEIAKMLKMRNKPVIVCVNKCDRTNDESSLCDFFSLGFDDVVPVSSVHGHGTGDLLDLISERVPEKKCKSIETIKVSIVGKPNVGKSSLVNRLCDKQSSIVSDVAGTTRDAVNSVVFGADGTCFTLIDTAGIRKKNNLKGNIERYSNFRSYDSVSMCDVCIVVIDACEWITSQDAKICGISKNYFKPCILLVNKWDKLESNPDNVLKFNKKIEELLKFASYLKVMYISAKTGRNCGKILDIIKQVYENSRRRISTSLLNSFLRGALVRVPPPSKNGKQLKIYYITQSGISPPTFVFFVNSSRLFHFSYERYLENRLREEYDFSGVCLRFIIKSKLDVVNKSLENQ